MSVFSWPLPGEGVTSAEIMAAQAALAIPGISRYSLDARRDAMLAEIAASFYNGQGLPAGFLAAVLAPPLVIAGAIQPDADNTAGRVLGTAALRWFDVRAMTGTFSGDLTLTARLLLTAGASKLVPGATSFSHRNAADSADNLIITDVGVATFRGDVVLSNASGAVPGRVRGNQGSPVAVEIVTADNTAYAAFRALKLYLSAAASVIIPGVTSLSLRNTADTQDNLLITDAGAITVRSTISGVTTLTATTLAGTLSTAAQPNVTSLGTLTLLTLSDGTHALVLDPTVPYIGTSSNHALTVRTNALARWSADTSGNWLADTTNGGTVQDRVGTSSTVAKHGRVLYQNQAVSTTSTTDASLASFSLPANALSANGQQLRINVTGTVATQNCTVHLKFGATDLALQTVQTTNSPFQFAVVLTRTGATAQVGSTVFVPAASNSTVNRSAPAETLANAITIDFRGSVVSGGTLTYDSVMVEYLAA